MVRNANENDLPELVRLAEIAVTESPTFNHDRFNALKTRKLFESLIQMPNGILVVAERSGTLVGAMAGSVSAHCYVDELFGYDLGLFMRPDARGRFTAAWLIREVERQVRKLGAVEFRPGVLTQVNHERTSQLYERLGYMRTGANLVKRF